jgi:glycosyltransferase involved in cell wall biosynthesis
VSQRTLDDLHAQRPRTRSAPATVVHHGADHALAWPRPAAPGDYAVAQGQHSNKNVELVIDAWALLAANGTAVPRLRVLGLPAERRAVLAATVQERGLDGLVQLSPFLPDAQFRAVMAGARLLVFPSDFEGFGLPVLEAMLLGIPVVVGPDPAVLEIAGGHARVLSGWSAAALAQAVDGALTTEAAALDEARRHAATFTWQRTAEQTRTAVAAAGYAPG